MLKDNVELVRKTLDEAGWRYETTDFGSAMAFTGAIGGFEGLFRSFRFMLIVGEGEVQNYTNFPMFAPADKMAATAELVARLNARQMFGGFLMDCDTGEIRYHVAFPAAEVVRNTKDALAFLLFSPAQMMAKCSTAFNAVMTGLQLPKEAFAACARELDAEAK